MLENIPLKNPKFEIIKTFRISYFNRFTDHSLLENIPLKYPESEILITFRSSYFHWIVNVDKIYKKLQFTMVSIKKNFNIQNNFLKQLINIFVDLIFAWKIVIRLHMLNAQIQFVLSICHC